MKPSRVALLLAGSLGFANAILAQAPPTVSEEEAPVLIAARPAVLFLPMFDQQAQPGPPPVSVLPQFDAADSRSTEDRYRGEIKLLAQKKHPFVHCKLKNGKVLTGILHDPGDKRFAIRTNALGEGTSVEYKNLAELPRAAPAVGTRIKQGMQLTGFVVC